MNRKDFLKLLGAAPLVGLAKYMPDAVDTKPTASTRSDVVKTALGGYSVGDIVMTDYGVAIYDGKRLRYLSVTTKKPE